jgi:hypothetical protein
MSLSWCPGSISMLWMATRGQQAAWAGLCNGAICNLCELMCRPSVACGSAWLGEACQDSAGLGVPSEIDGPA